MKVSPKKKPAPVKKAEEKEKVKKQKPKAEAKPKEKKAETPIKKEAKKKKRVRKAVIRKMAKSKCQNARTFILSFGFWAWPTRHRPALRGSGEVDGFEIWAL